ADGLTRVTVHHCDEIGSSDADRPIEPTDRELILEVDGELVIPPLVQASDPNGAAQEATRGAPVNVEHVAGEQPAAAFKRKHGADWIMAGLSSTPNSPTDPERLAHGV